MKRIIISLLTLLATATMSAQQQAEANNILTYIKTVMQFNKYAPQEKVYLHLDNTGYFKGETIRFKAYATRQDNGAPTDLSRVLYVELVNPTGDVCERRILKLEKGEAEGDIQLDSIVGVSGFFELRAYTRYMTNWGTEAIFSRVIPIFNKPKTEGNYQNPILDRISQRNRLPNTRVDSNGQTPESTTDLQMASVRFYPEGGDLVNGLTSRVAISATDKEGHHRKLTATLMNQQKQKLATVETDETGRGVFEATPTTEGGNLYVEIADGNGRPQQYQLPQAKTDGCVLTLDMMDDDIIVADIHNTASLNGQLLGYTVMSGGNVLLCDTIRANGSFTKRISKYSLPAGVNQFTVFDSKGQILADRLFFIYPYPEATDSITVSTETRYLTPCGKITIDIEAEPGSSISFSAMDAATTTGGREGNMKTWMLLSSEVAGYIDNPDYYFEADDPEHRRQADLLMMVQGWRRYDWTLMAGLRQLDKVEPIEDGLYIYGKLSHRSKKKDVGNVDLQAFLYNRSGQSMSGQAKTDSIGRYSFQLPEIYDDWMLQIKSKKEGEAENYIIGIDRHFAPPMRLLSPYETITLPKAEASFFKANAEEADDEEWVSITKKTHVLPTVKIKRRRILGDETVTWFDEDLAQRKATVYYDCDPFADQIGDLGEDMPTFDDWLKAKNSLIDGLSNPTYDDLVYVQPSMQGTSNGDTEGEVQELAGKSGDVNMSDIDRLFQTSEEKPILCYRTGLTYDRRPIVWIVNNTFCTITNFTPKTFSFIRTNNHTGVIERPDFLNEVKSIYFTDNLYGVDEFIVSADLPGLNPIIAYVYTHPLFFFKEKGLRKSHYYGYNRPTKFVMEDYSIMPPTEDFRRTIYWDANVKTDQHGKASVSFYNNSSATQLYISAEGMTPEGKILINE
ncbi:MAG: hypothetical protein IJ139_01745 [Bacteroidaceae bacterium]|nr:hypothetical protein [Bacteroidaceae bacterium]